MIKRVIIENFKSIKHLDIELAPLTIFMGPNGSGKSSILEAIGLMNQAVIMGKSLVESRIGNLVYIEDKEALFCKRELEQWLSLGIEVELENNEVSSIRDAISKDIEYIKDSSEEIKTFFNKLKAKEIKTIKYVNRVRVKEKEEYAYECVYYINDTQLKYCMDKEKRLSLPEGLYPVGWSGEFLAFGWATINGRSLNFPKEISEIIKKKISNVYYLSPERGSIPWYYKVESEETPKYVGRKGEHTLEVLATLMKPENDDKRLPYELLSTQFGIENVWSGWHKKNILTSNYKDPWLKSAHKFPSLGYGSKQLLSIIAQLAYSEKGDIILIDEPEISLHPEYQVKLTALFGNAVKEGKQILLATHSSYFPLSIHLLFSNEGIKLKGQTTRGEKEFKIKLNVEDVAIYHVTRDKEGYTKAEKLEIDENGLKEAIPSFAEVEINLLSRFMKEE